MARNGIVIALVALCAGCGLPRDWYRSYGIPDEGSLSRPESIPKLVQALEFNWHGDQERAGAILALLADAGPAAKGAVQVFARRAPEMLNGCDDPAQHLPFLRSLGRIDAEASAGVTLRLVLAGSSDSIRLNALTVLGMLDYNGPEVRTALEKASTGDSNAKVRERAGNLLRALESLATLGPKGASRSAAKGATGQVFLAVFDIQAPSTRFKREDLDQLTEYLVARLADASFKIVPRDQLRARLVEEKTTGYRECFDQTCQIELGKAMAAQKTLSTKVLAVGSTCAVTATLYDLQTEATERAASTRSSCSESGLMDAMDQIALQLKAPASGTP